MRSRQIRRERPLPYLSGTTQCNAVQRPVNAHLPAYFFTQLFLLSSRTLAKVNFIKLCVFEKSCNSGKMGKSYCIKLILQCKKYFSDNLSLYVYFSKAKSSKLFSARISQN
jgi:hypothetical protein